MNFSRYNFTAYTVSGAVFTSTAHELYTDDQIIVETTSVLPAGLALDTTYYVIRDGITADTFKISASKGGDPITTTSGGTGTQTWLKVNRARLEPSNESNK